MAATNVCRRQEPHRSEPGERRAHHPRRRDLRRRREHVQQGGDLQVLQFVFYGLAAVAGGTGVYLLATSPSSAPKTGLTIQPYIGSGTGKVDLTYHF